MVIEQFGKLNEQMKNVLSKYHMVEFGISMAEIGIPQLSAGIESVKHVCSISDEIRFDAIIKGLTEENNVEMRMNELYSYVTDSNRAFYVSDCFRKAMLGKSPIVCCIMGMILGDIVKDGREFKQKDTVLLNALHNFSDFDICNLTEMVKEEYKTEGYIDIFKFPQEQKEEFLMTLELCKQNRLIKIENPLIDGTLTLDSKFSCNKSTNELLIYIERARRQMDYTK